MTADPHEAIVPVVLVGGRSRRFGRDKLLEPVGGGRLVEHAIRVLRGVFGPRVLLVGDCDAAVRTLGDRHLPDTHPGAGPIGGIIAALGALGALEPVEPVETVGAGGGAIFVLAGDMPAIDAASVRAVLAAADAHPGALAVLAQSDRIHPCVGLYRKGALPILRRRLDDGRRSLHDALPAAQRTLVALAPAALRNVNESSDLDA